MIKVEVNTRWCVECDYDVFRDCDNAGCDGICRCSELENIVITDITEPSIIIKEDSGKNGRWVNYKLSDIEKYCIDRIKVYTGVYDKGNWSIDVQRGYYGQELSDPCFSNDTLLEQRIKEVVELNSEIEKVKYVLGLEYEFTADTIKDCVTAEIVNVDKESVITRFSEDGFIRKTDTKYFMEIDTSLPVCVVTDNMKLVDGNNRLLDMLFNYSIKTIKVIKLR